MIIIPPSPGWNIDWLALVQVLVGNLSCFEFLSAAVLAGPEDTVLLASSQRLALTVSLLLPCDGS